MLNPEVLKCHEDLITLDTYVQQGNTMDNKFYGDICTTRGNNLKTIFSFMGQNVKKRVYFWGILGA